MTAPTPPGPDGPSPAARRQKGRLAAYRLGLRAETLAALFLRLKGFRILARRYRAGSGEIDIIARRGATVIFVEVKARASREAALAALTPQGRRRIAAAARHWQAGRRDLGNATLRFDMVLIVPFRLPEHVINAFEAEGR
jgi:putative endonuclease